MVETPQNNQAMSEEQIPAVAPAMPPGARRKDSWNVWFSVLFIITLLVSGAALSLAWQNRDAGLAARSALDNALKSTARLDARLGQTEAQLAELRDAQEATARSVQDLYRELPGGSEDWALAESEFLLVIATHHLRLEHDAEAALNAMQAAELRLRGLNNPALDPVREQVATDIGRLREANTVDISDLALMLGDLTSRVNNLPLADAEAGKKGEVIEPEQKPHKGLLGVILRELRRLVVIRHTDEKPQPPLLPGKEYFIYQNLRLELEGARLALLRRDTQNLHLAVDSAQRWLEEYFAMTDPGVMNVMSSLQQLSSVNPAPPLPDISSSLESLRAYLREKASPAGAADKGERT